MMTDNERELMEPEYNRALALRENNPHEAIRILKELDRRFPNHEIIVGTLGSIYFSLKDWANALPVYERATQLAPKSELASLGLFHSLWHHERYDDAVEEAKRFIRINGLTPEYSLLLDELDDEGMFSSDRLRDLADRS